MPHNNLFDAIIVDVSHNPPISGFTPGQAGEDERRWQRELQLRRTAREKIMQHWLQTGGSKSPVGLPMDPNFPVFRSGNIRTTQFRGGRITFNDADAQVVQSDLHHAVVTFEGIGLEIRQERGDEIYGSLHVQIGSTGFRKELTLGEVTLGPDANNRIQQYGMVLYEGPPTDLNIVLSVVENDSGNRAAVRDEVRKRVAEIFKTAEDAASAGQLGDAAQRAASSLNTENLASSSLKGWLITGVADIVNAILGMGDDPYNPVGFTITAAELQAIPPLRQYRCSSDPRTLNFTDPHRHIATCRDDGGDVGQISALFSVRAR